MLIHRLPRSTPGAFGDIPFDDGSFVLTGTPIEVILGSVTENIDFALNPVPAFADPALHRGVRRGLDRRLGRPRYHCRLRRGQLLPAQSRVPGRDGGLSGENLQPAVSERMVHGCLKPAAMAHTADDFRSIDLRSSA